MAGAAERGLAPPGATGIEQDAGIGAWADVDGARVGVVRPDHTGVGPWPGALRDEADRLAASGATLALVVRDGSPVGVIGLADEARPGARAAIDRLRALGVGRFVMLTGDHAGAAAHVAETVGLEEVRAGLTPEEKMDAIPRAARVGGRRGDGGRRRQRRPGAGRGVGRRPRWAPRARTWRWRRPTSR